MQASTAESISRGRPTDYNPDYARKLIDFFTVEPFRLSTKTFTTKNGTVIEEEVEIANKLPTFERFAASEIGVSVDALKSWADRYPEFGGAYLRAKTMQKDHLIQNGIKGLYNSQFTIFVAKNITDMKDVQTIETIPADDTMIEARLQQLLAKMSPEQLSKLTGKRMIDVTPQLSTAQEAVEPCK